MADRSLGFNISTSEDFTRACKAMEASAEKFSRMLDKLDGKVARVRVEADNKGANAGLDETERKRKELDGKTANVKVDIDKRKFTDAANAWALLSRNMRTLALPVGIAAAAPMLLEFGQAAGVASQSLLLLPAAGAAAGIVLGTIKLGVSGLGDAFKALAKGDMAKFGEDLKKLSPEARGFALAVQSIKPGFDSMRMGVQNALFAKFGDTLKGLADTYLPVLRTGFVGIASEINSAGLQIAGFVRQSQTVNDVRTIFANTRDTMHELSPAGVAILRILRDIATVGSSFLPGLASGFTKLTQKAADFVAKARETGRLHEWIADGLSAVSLLAQTFVNAGSIIASVFRALNSDTGGFLTRIRDLSGKVADFFKSAKGQQELVKVFGALRSLASALAPVLGAIALAVLGMVETLAPSLPPLFKGLTDVYNAAGPLLGVFGELLAQILPPLGKALSALAPILGPLVMVISAGAIAMKIYATTLAIVAAATKAWAVAQAILNGTLLLNPIGLIVVAIAALAAILVYAWNHSETFRRIVTAAWDGIKAAAQAAWDLMKPIFEAIGTALSTVGHFFSDLWTNWVKPAWDAITGATGAVVDDLKGKWQGFQDWIAPFWNAFAGMAATAWDTISGFIIDRWGKIWGNLQTGWQVFRDWIGPVWDAFDTYISGAWDRFKTDITERWNAIWGVLQPAWQGFLDFIVPAWDAFTTTVGTYWTAIKTLIQDDWNLVWGVLKPVWTEFRDWITTEWNTWAPIVGAIWTAVTGQIKDAWEAVWAYLGPIWAGFRDYIGAEWNAWSPYVSAYWDGIKTVISDYWAATWPVMETAWQGWVTYIVPEFAAFKAYSDQHWGGVKTSTTDQWIAIWPVLQAAWTMFSGWISGQWNAFYGWFTGGWSRMGTAIKAEWSGWTSAAQHTWDTIVGVFNTGTHGVVTALNWMITQVNKVLSFLHVGTIPGLEAGGTVPALAAGGSIGGGFKTNGPRAIVGEGNPSHPEYVIPTDPKYRSRAQGLYGELGPQLMASGGVVGDVAGFLTGGVGGAVDSILGGMRDMVPAGLFRDVAGGIANLLGGGLKSMIQSAWDAFQAALAAAAAAAAGVFGGGGGGGGGSVSAGGARGWIIAHESGGNPRAQNPTSSASGLYQFIDGTWRSLGGSTAHAKDASVAEQNAIADRYVSSRYGGWEGAVAFWQRNGWYDRGGILSPGVTMAVNNTGGPERVLSPSETRLYDRAPVGSGSNALIAELRQLNGTTRMLRGDVDQGGYFAALIGEVHALRTELASTGRSVTGEAGGARYAAVLGAF